MSIPVFILAGQSNASELSDEIEAALEDRYGEGSYELLSVYTGGAPLTRGREDKPDWNDPTEMRQDLTTGMIDALNEDSDRVVGGMIWIQGEADTYFAHGAAGYSEDLEGLIDNFRDDVSDAMGDRDTGLDVAPVTILELSDNAPEASEREAWDRIISEQRDVTEVDPLVATLDPDMIAEDSDVPETSMFKDGLHYDNTFQYVLAEELVETMTPPSAFEDVKEGEPPLDSFDSQTFPVDNPVEATGEPVIPVVDRVEPYADEDDEPFDEFDDGTSMGDLAWVLAFLPFLGLLG